MDASFRLRQAIASVKYLESFNEDDLATMRSVLMNETTSSNEKEFLSNIIILLHSQLKPQSMTKIHNKSRKLAEKYPMPKDVNPLSSLPLNVTLTIATFLTKKESMDVGKVNRALYIDTNSKSFIINRSFIISKQQQQVCSQLASHLTLSESLIPHISYSKGYGTSLGRYLPTSLTLSNFKDHFDSSKSSSWRISCDQFFNKLVDQPLGRATFDSLFQNVNLLRTELSLQYTSLYGMIPVHILFNKKLHKQPLDLELHGSDDLGELVLGSGRRVNQAEDTGRPAEYAAQKLKHFNKFLNNYENYFECRTNSRNSRDFRIRRIRHLAIKSTVPGARQTVDISHIFGKLASNFDELTIHGNAKICIKTRKYLDTIFHTNLQKLRLIGKVGIDIECKEDDPNHVISSSKRSRGSGTGVEVLQLQQLEGDAKINEDDIDFGRLPNGVERIILSGVKHLKNLIKYGVVGKSLKDFIIVVTPWKLARTRAVRVGGNGEGSKIRESCKLWKGFLAAILETCKDNEDRLECLEKLTLDIDMLVDSTTALCAFLRAVVELREEICQLCQLQSFKLFCFQCACTHNSFRSDFPKFLERWKSVKPSASICATVSCPWDMNSEIPLIKDALSTDGVMTERIEDIAKWVFQPERTSNVLALKIP